MYLDLIRRFSGENSAGQGSRLSAVGTSPSSIDYSLLSGEREFRGARLSPLSFFGRKTKLADEGSWVTGSHVIASTPLPESFFADLGVQSKIVLRGIQGYLIKVAQAQPVDGQQIAITDGVTHIFRFRQEGRKVVAYAVGQPTLLVRNLNKGGVDALGLMRMDDELSKTILLATRGIQEDLSVPKVFVLDIDYFQHYPDDLFKRVVAGAFEYFESVYASKGVTLQVTSSTMREALVTRALSLKSADSGQIVRTLTQDIKHAIQQDRARLVNLLSVSKNTTSLGVETQGRLMPLRELSENDYVSVEATLAMAYAIANADLNNAADVASLRNAWKIFTGLDIPEGVLSRIIQTTADIKLIFKYALLPVIPVTIELMREAYMSRQARVAA